MGASWTTTEIALLKAAVARHGLPSTDAEWRRISDAVGTRDSKKCYQKWLHLASPPTPKWTAQHDTEIKRRRDARHGLGADRSRGLQRAAILKPWRTASGRMPSPLGGRAHQIVVVVVVSKRTKSALL